jgi:4-hydroxy-2-oxoheptanedioate aldolase
LTVAPAQAGLSVPNIGVRVFDSNGLVGKAVDLQEVLTLNRPLQRRGPPLSVRGPNEVVLGVHLSLLNAELVKLCGLLGFKWLFLDAQRTPLTPALSHELVRAADLTGMFCLVRVSYLDVAQIQGFLNAGAAGIIAASISNAADARALVNAVKFPPQGTRGESPRSREGGHDLSNFSGAGGHATSPAPCCCLEANGATCAAALIESPRGIEHLQDILAVPGLDYIAFGPNDLALSLGAVSSKDTSVRALLDAAGEQLRAAGKPRIEVVLDAAEGQLAAADGATLIAVPDTALLRAAGSQFLQDMRSS